MDRGPPLFRTTWQPLPRPLESAASNSLWSACQFAMDARFVLGALLGWKVLAQIWGDRGAAHKPPRCCVKVRVWSKRGTPRGECSALTEQAQLEAAALAETRRQLAETRRQLAEARNAAEHAALQLQDAQQSSKEQGSRLTTLDAEVAHLEHQVAALSQQLRSSIDQASQDAQFLKAENARLVQQHEAAVRQLRALAAEEEERRQHDQEPQHAERALRGLGEVATEPAGGLLQRRQPIAASAARQFGLQPPAQQREQEQGQQLQQEGQRQLWGSCKGQQGEGRQQQQQQEEQAQPQQEDGNQQQQEEDEEQLQQGQSKERCEMQQEELQQAAQLAAENERLRAELEEVHAELAAALAENSELEERLLRVAFESQHLSPTHSGWSGTGTFSPPRGGFPLCEDAGISPPASSSYPTHSRHSLKAEKESGSGGSLGSSNLGSAASLGSGGLGSASPGISGGQGGAALEGGGQCSCSSTHDVSSQGSGTLAMTGGQGSSGIGSGRQGSSSIAPFTPRKEQLQKPPRQQQQ